MLLNEVNHMGCLIWFYLHRQIHICLAHWIFEVDQNVWWLFIDKFNIEYACNIYISTKCSPKICLFNEWALITREMAKCTSITFTLVQRQSSMAKCKQSCNWYLVNVKKQCWQLFPRYKSLKSNLMVFRIISSSMGHDGIWSVGAERLSRPR